MQKINQIKLASDEIELVTLSGKQETTISVKYEQKGIGQEKIIAGKM